MKKTLILYIEILVGLGLVLMVFNINGDYAAEKQLWRIDREFATIAQDPKASPDAAYDRVIKKYEHFIKRFAHSRLQPLGYIFLGRVYSTHQDYRHGRSIFETAIARNKDKSTICLMALSEIGKTYVLEQNFPKVLETYDRVFKSYPQSDIGWRVPLLKASIYSLQKKEDLKQQTLADAVAYYKSMSQKNKKSLVGFVALRFLAETQIILKQWQDAEDTFRTILIEYPDPQYLTPSSAAWILRSVNVIAINELKNPQVAMGIYQQFIQTYPRHRLNKTLSVLVDTLKNPPKTKTAK
ncbi:MAG: tetratricopeptide repeat protein [Candidatus Omnitrophica bacterium]|nr:tetratricopeptide repeat protein [Candidatus Omnitrophota bacterium]